MRALALLLCGLVQFIVAPHAAAAACVTATLADYVALGPAGCTAAGLTFDTFSVAAPLAPGVAPVDPTTVTLTPTSGPGGPGFAFTSATPLAAGPGEVLQLWFGFRVAGASGVSADSIVLGGPGSPPLVSGDGAITMVEDTCLDGLFAAPSSGCAGDLQTQIAFAIDGDEELEATQPLLVASFFDVFVDLTIDGGLAGDSLLGPQLGAYRLRAAAQAPEPAPLVLLAIALLAGACVRGRRPRAASR